MNYKLLQQRLIYICFLFLVLLSYPVIGIYDRAVYVFKIPASLLGLLALWILFIAVLFYTAKRIKRNIKSFNQEEE
jgi:putative effector of murein hydrolase LrgA (UPF0299 family)